jgi:hypothetical protein
VRFTDPDYSPNADKIGSEVSVKQLMLVLFMVAALAGCKDRVIWNDNGKVEEATTDREVWDSEGKMEAGERKIWTDKDGNDVIK